MVRFRTPYNYVFGESLTDYSIVRDDISLTEPDQAMSIRDLFARAVAGMPLGAPSFTPSYPDGDDPDFDDYDELLDRPNDLTDYMYAADELEFNRRVREERASEAKRPDKSDGTDGTVEPES